MAHMVDIHCHIVPSVDDGAKDMKTALELLRMEYEDGVRSIIVTPHFRKGMFETSQEDISQQFFYWKKKYPGYIRICTSIWGVSFMPIWI